MSGRVEKMLQDYPQMVMERICLENQIRNFKGITEGEMIESMNFSHSEGEQVQTSGVSDKTGRIAISYREKRNRINKEWLEHLEERHSILLEELVFFESAVFSLGGILSDLISDMVIKGLTWDDIATKYNISRTMVAKYRKNAIRELEVLYAIHDKEIAEYILS